MVGGTIRRKVIHRESFRASVLHLSEIQAVLQSIAEKKSVLTTPSLLSSATQLAPHRREDGPPRGLRGDGAGVSASGGKVLFLFGAGRALSGSGCAPVAPA